uniref:Uncharacterized protein n=1 Tax=Candidatus Kentrum sp. FW TaxID=2126338 RepID=A0A450SBR7_9GAMM|nr:MAG: hypothetical protein BECKFW1821A_GA0114235_10249 [Candidatus Kentron sp. FW]VFJ52115.1 MAG: hypothetical protein BECKFW1821B_GA0114236_101130 [Candidatus Kentron sp. FW]
MLPSLALGSGREYRDLTPGTVKTNNESKVWGTASLGTFPRLRVFHALPNFYKVAFLLDDLEIEPLQVDVPKKLALFLSLDTLGIPDHGHTDRESGQALFRFT